MPSTIKNLQNWISPQKPPEGIFQNIEQKGIAFSKWITASDPLPLPSTTSARAVRSFKIFAYDMLYIAAGKKPKPLSVSYSEKGRAFVANVIKVSLFVSQLPILIVTGAMAWFAAPLIGISPFITLPLWGVAAMYLTTIEIKLDKPEPPSLTGSERVVRWYQETAYDLVHKCIGDKPKSQYRSGLTRGFVITRRVTTFVAAGIALSAASYGAGVGLINLSAKLEAAAVASPNAFWATHVSSVTPAMAAVGEFVSSVARQAFLAIAVPVYTTVYTLPNWLMADGLPKMQSVALRSLQKLDSTLPDVLNTMHVYTKNSLVSLAAVIDKTVTILTPVVSKTVETITRIAAAVFEAISILVPAIADGFSWTATNVLSPTLKAVATTTAWLWSSGILLKIMGF